MDWPGRAALRADHLADLHDLLEAPQVVAQLLVRLLAEQLRDDGARTPARRAVAQVDHDLRAPPARGVAEAHRAGVLDVGALEGPPGISSPSRSSTISASQRTVDPAGPVASQCERPDSSVVTERRCAMNSGRRSRSRHRRYVSDRDRLTVTAAEARHSPAPLRRESARAVDDVRDGHPRERREGRPEPCGHGSLPPRTGDHRGDVEHVAGDPAPHPPGRAAPAEDARAVRQLPGAAQTRDRADGRAVLPDPHQPCDRARRGELRRPQRQTQHPQAPREVAWSRPGPILRRPTAAPSSNVSLRAPSGEGATGSATPGPGTDESRARRWTSRRRVRSDGSRWRPARPVGARPARRAPARRL